MENDIEKVLGALLALQAVDCGLDRITKLRGALPKEVETLENDLLQLQVRLQRTQDELASLEQEITDRRTSIKDSEVLIKKYEEQQMNVRNNREHDAITKEVDLQKLEMQLTEKRIKGDYERIEAKKIALEKIQASTERNKQVLASKQDELKALIEQSEGDEKTLHDKRNDVKANMDAEQLDNYERIRANVRNKLAVITVKNEACSGCFSSVPPQRQSEIKAKKRIITCEHCGRIIADVTEPDEEKA
jgi:predicted  nucleic acid-binding Zn-ribbon protein